MPRYVLVIQQFKAKQFFAFQLEDDSIKMRSDLKNILYELRIEATVQVIEMVRQQQISKLQLSYPKVGGQWPCDYTIFKGNEFSTIYFMV